MLPNASMAGCANLVVRRCAYLAASRQLEHDSHSVNQEMRTDPDEWKRWTFESYCMHWQSRFSLADIEVYWQKCCYRTENEILSGSRSCMPGLHSEAPDPCTYEIDAPFPMDGRVFGNWEHEEAEQDRKDDDAEEDWDGEDAEEDWENEDAEEANVEDEESQEVQRSQHLAVPPEDVEDVEVVAHVPIVVPEEACVHHGCIQTSESGKDTDQLADDKAASPSSEHEAINAALSPSCTKGADVRSSSALLSVPSPSRSRAHLGF